MKKPESRKQLEEKNIQLLCESRYSFNLYDKSTVTFLFSFLMITVVYKCEINC